MTRVRTRSNLVQYENYLGARSQIGSPSITYEWCNSPWRETCNDELHKKKRLRNGARVWRNGGPFQLERNIITRTYTDEFSLQSGLLRYNGRFCDGQLGMDSRTHVQGAYIVDPNSISGKGATGIARSKPGVPTHGLGQAIIELRQIPTIPNIKAAVKRLANIQETVKSFRGLGGQYLNIEFGWKPLLADIFSILTIQEKLEKQLAQLRRDNGKAVRRRITVSRYHNSTVTSDTGVCSVYPILTTGFYDTTIPLTQRFGRTQVITDSERYWFAGRFRYWIPDLDTIYGQNRIKYRLLGLAPTPKLLWEVMPWSWLIDWFTNVGDIIDNMSTNAAENLVMEYGYVMGSYSRTFSYHSNARLNTGKTVYASTHLEKVVKRRAKGNPFGFSASGLDPTVRQAAILAALGLSKRQSTR